MEKNKMIHRKGTKWSFSILFEEILNEDFKLIKNDGGNLFRIKSTQIEETKENWVEEIKLQNKSIKKMENFLIRELIKRGIIKDNEEEIATERKVVERFLSSLIFAVGQPNNPKLDEIIVDHIKEKLPGRNKERRAAYVKASYQEKMTNWSEERRPEPLTRAKLDEFLPEIKNKETDNKENRGRIMRDIN